MGQTITAREIERRVNERADLLAAELRWLEDQPDWVRDAVSERIGNFSHPPATADPDYMHWIWWHPVTARIWINTICNARTAVDMLSGIES